LNFIHCHRSFWGLFDFIVPRQSCFPFNAPAATFWLASFHGTKAQAHSSGDRDRTLPQFEAGLGPRQLLLPSIWELNSALELRASSQLP